MTETFWKLGIIGYPLGHSLSPLLHAELLKATGLSGEYKPYELTPEALAQGFASLERQGIAGLNVTIPHKTTVIPLLDWIQPEARMLGAVNTVQFTPEQKKGYNTDIIGFIRSLPAHVTERLPESHVLILGAGGSARAVLGAFIQSGAAEITLAVRNPQSALPLISLADELKRFHQQESSVHLLALQELPSLCGFQGVVNTTPVGMWPNVTESLLTAIQLESLPSGAFVYDLIYRPERTRLLADAETLGYTIFNGLDMLIYQGIAAFELWTGATVPEKLLPHLREKLAQTLLHPVK
jgi:shikimate dehydrogenase